VAVAASEGLRFLWLEITGRCQLRCRHCYSDSGPDQDHGSMTTANWRRVLDEAADLGVGDVQLIGGEPTLHPDLPELVRHALARGMAVEVYSNLVRVTSALWDVFDRPGVRLATSYYSADAARHDAVTGRRSHDRTLANIREAVRRGIPLRVGLVDMDDEQGIEGAVAELRMVGVEHVSVDRLRQVGRAMGDGAPDVDQLCGHCADGTLTVSSTGDVWPCPMARWLVIGNIHEAPVAALHERAGPLREMLLREFVRIGTRSDKCSPNDADPCGGPLCNPHIKCGPDDDKDKKK
jgi:sulfatase maturation enzyme AslB (radical SAM superfamily)